MVSPLPAGSRAVALVLTPETLPPARPAVTDGRCRGIDRETQPSCRTGYATHGDLVRYSTGKT